MGISSGKRFAEHFKSWALNVVVVQTEGRQHRIFVQTISKGGKVWTCEVAMVDVQ